MNEWALLLVASTMGSLASLVGGLLLLAKRISVRRVQLLAVPFAAGALLAAALVDLLPAALESGGEAEEVLALVLGGFVLFFVLERFLGWFHHHHVHDGSVAAVRPRKSARSLIVIGDALHNTIDGMVIGAAFLVDPVIGVITTAAIAAHEVPQEIGDFGVLLSMGMSRRNVLLVNILSAVATVVAASLVFALGSALSSYEPILLALAAGMFIYIAGSDLIPTIHEERSPKVANLQTLILLFGIVFIGMITTLTHEFLEHPAGEGEVRSGETHTE